MLKQVTINLLELTSSLVLMQQNFAVNISELHGTESVNTLGIKVLLQ